MKARDFNIDLYEQLFNRKIKIDPICTLIPDEIYFTKSKIKDPINGFIDVFNTCIYLELEIEYTTEPRPEDPKSLNVLLPLLEHN